jgi:biofilm PGA synthesis lipoprotein PgaB
METFVRKIKIYFSFAVIVLVVFGFGLGLILSDRAVASAFAYAKSTVSYLQYHREFTRLAKGTGSLSASIWSVLWKNENPAVSVSSSMPKGLARSVPVLLYHGIVDRPDGANVTVENFKDQMFTLKKAGYETVSLNDFHAFVNGEKQLPDRSFVLTFDDGAKDSYYPVDPILKTVGFRAATFIISRYSADKGTGYYLSSGEVKEALDSGRWEIQAHAKNGHNFYPIDNKGREGHFYAHRLWKQDENRLETPQEYEARVSEDMRLVREELESVFQVKTPYFAFPFGDFGQNNTEFPEAREILVKSLRPLYDLAFYQTWPANGATHNYPEQNPFLVRRIAVNRAWTGSQLLAFLEDGRPKDLAFDDYFGSNKGWVNGWGRMDYKSGQLTVGELALSASEDTVGSLAFLDGGRLWRDYTFTADLRFVKGNSVSLLARFHDNIHYAACNFYPGTVTIEDRIGESARLLMKSEANLEPASGNRLRLGVRVIGDRIGCLIDGVLVASAAGIDPTLYEGSVGFKTWDPQLNNSEIHVYEAHVESAHDEALLAQLAQVFERLSEQQKAKARKVAIRAKASVPTPPAKAPEKANHKPNEEKSSLPAKTEPAEEILPYRKTFTDDAGWPLRWGVHEIKNGELLIGSHATGTTGFVSLKNAGTWKNYSLRAQIRWITGERIYVVARYKDDRNYLACRITGNFIEVEQVIDGDRSTLAKADVSVSIPRGDLPLGIEVYGNAVACGLNGQRATTNNIHPSLDAGTVGFKTYDPVPGNSLLAIKYVLIDEAR